jgi:hypothetical protein
MQTSVIPIIENPGFSLTSHSTGQGKSDIGTSKSSNPTGNATEKSQS